MEAGSLNFKGVVGNENPDRLSSKLYQGSNRSGRDGEARVEGWRTWTAPPIALNQAMKGKRIKRGVKSKTRPSI